MIYNHDGVFDTSFLSEAEKVITQNSILFIKSGLWSKINVKVRPEEKQEISK